MTQSTNQALKGAHRSESGFTLVELAIVMIIIGLLIGGILKGQELINNARVSSSVTQIKGAEAAINTFKEKYAALPGDMANATTRLPNCGAGTVCASVPAAATVGNGFIGAGDIGAANAVQAATEQGVMWTQLALSNLLTGNVNPNVAWAAGTALPDFNLGGKMLVMNNTAAAPTGTQAAAAFTGHVLAAGSLDPAAAMGTERIRVSFVQSIDNKLDDGQPNTGSVVATGTLGAAAGNCITAAGAAGLYNQAQDGNVCGLMVRILN